MLRPCFLVSRKFEHDDCRTYWTVSFTRGSDAELAPYGWSTPYIPALLPTSATFVIGFLWWEERRERCHKHALLPPSVWKAKGMTVMLVVIFLGWMGTFRILSVTARYE